MEPPSLFQFVKDLSPKDRIQLASASSRLTLPSNKILYLQGTPATTFYCITKGRVLEKLDGINTGVIHDKDAILGLAETLVGGTYRHTIRATEDSTIQAFPWEAIRRKNLPGLEEYLFQGLAHQILFPPKPPEKPERPTTLKGNLENFEIPNLLQLLLHSHFTGGLHINFRTQRAELLFSHGKVKAVCLGTQRGIDAYNALFLQKPQGHFEAYPLQNITENHPGKIEGNASPEAMLLNALCLKDEQLAL